MTETDIEAKRPLRGDDTNNDEEEEEDDSVKAKIIKVILLFKFLVLL
jgi:hypothetical protein